jgi:two-component system, OmpR family, response regulator
MTEAGALERQILIADDDVHSRDSVAAYLARHDYRVLTCGDATAMEKVLSHRKVDVLVLDVTLPGEGGLPICRRLSTARGPAIIMLSAGTDDTDRILGLELGADDVLAKPCNPRELLARIRAVQRRCRPRPANDVGADVYGFAGWRFDLGCRELRAPGGGDVSLTGGQFSVFSAMVQRPMRVLTRDQLLEYAVGPDAESFDRAIDVQISRLRMKLRRWGGENLIRTVRNEGYMFTVKPMRAGLFGV